LPDLKIAIECDEYGHIRRSNKDEGVREKLIKEKLGCEFLRFNPNEIDFNIGSVINEIFKRLIRKSD